MSADREQWQRARALFDELVELDASARQARLDEIGRTDAALRHDVERLLAADTDADAALEEYSFGSAGEPPATPSADPLGITGRTVSHFQIRDFVAAGGMGVVYSAVDITLARTVALKFPLPHQHLGREVKERFVNEARSAAALDHPALCSIHEIGESEHGVFLAMPLYNGETLKDRMAREGRLEPGAALDIIVQVTAGLAAAHAAGIIHRDLKPGNVMLLPDGTVKVLDFGLAKIRDVDLTRSHMTLGTIGYVAPEQLRGERADARADLWSIGVMLHEMVTGTPPFRREHELSVLNAVLHDEPPRPTELNPDLSPAFDDLISALLRKDPAHRYPSADALLADLEALKRGAPIALRTPFWQRTERRRRMRRMALPAAVIAIVALGGATWSVLANGASGSAASQDGTAAAGLAWVDGTAEVGTAAELLLALDPANAGRRVRLRPGVYDVEQPLTLPDGMTLEGAGVMRFDSAGLPVGFTDETRTTLRVTVNVGGDMLTLGDSATVRNIEIVDLAGRSGNIVAVLSRRADDRISAAIIESVITNPNPLTIGASGPLGRSVLVLTRNPNLGAEPAPHDGAALAVRMVRSIIRAPEGGGAFFAYNFAANSSISVDVTRSVIGGSSEANGGVSRPDAVHDSEVVVRSEGSVYRNEWPDPCVSPLIGWNLTGGSGSPIPIPQAATTRNRLVVMSVEDRLEGFTTAILATGSRRFFGSPMNPPPDDNAIDLSLIGTTISTPACARPGSANITGLSGAGTEANADFSLAGAWVENDALHPGDRNIVRVELRGVTASGPRSNRFAHVTASSGPLPARLPGDGNRLELIGDVATFARVNRAIDPAPAATFFTGGRTAR